MAQKSLPEEDLKLINDSFKKTDKAQILTKDSVGYKVGAAEGLVNRRSHVLKDFRGKILKHEKSVIPIGGKQTVVGVKGQRYDEIPLELRKSVDWFESDFE